MTLQASSIGIGTYLGKEDDRTDELYLDAITRAVEQGCNVIDTAINYREMKSERVVGRAVKLIVATKGGFIPGDIESGEEPSEFFQNRFLKKGILTEEDVVQGCHSLKPEFIRSSATLLQTRALDNSKLFSFQALSNLGNGAARRAIQVVRSLRGVTTSLVGMKTVKHVQDNLHLLKVPKLEPDEAKRILGEFF
ncbi:MAG: aldo/keto reductase [Candidatus Brocadia sinica]|nr:aldo/keto reductase [Candidatus Brocadia sinica]